MGGLTSRRFLDIREQLSHRFGIEKEAYDPETGRNEKLDECLEDKSLLTDSKTFRSFFWQKGMSKKAVEREITWERIISAMCCIGYGSDVLHTKRPDLKILGLIIDGLKLLSKKKTTEETLIEERMNNRKGDVLFRLIRPFFCHQLTEAVVALLGKFLSREYWRCNWSIIDCTLAALYRYIPRGRKASLGSRKLLKVVNAVAQVGLQGQDIASTIIGTIEQHLVQAKIGKHLNRYIRSHVGPKIRPPENKPVAFYDFNCFKMKAPSKRAEQVFRDLVELGERHVLDQLDHYFNKQLLREITSTEFIANPYLNWDEARERRNEIYSKIGGKGYPWSHVSWTKKSKPRRKCDPKLGWKACMLINDYLSGTINCSGLADVNKVWRELKDSKGFTPCKTINRLATGSRDLVCIGHLNLKQPINFEFECCRKHFNIDLFLVTIRIRHNLPILDGYNHFEDLQRNYLLRSFHSPDQLFIPRLCKYEERKHEREPQSKTPLKLQPRTQSMPDLPNLPGKKCCPKNHPLYSMPAPYDDLKCEDCGKTLKQRAIMHHCIPCHWTLCGSCFHRTAEKRRTKDKSFSAYDSRNRWFDAKEKSFSAYDSRNRWFDAMDSTSDVGSRGSDIDDLCEFELHSKNTINSFGSRSATVRSRGKRIDDLRSPRNGRWLQSNSSRTTRRLPDMKDYASAPSTQSIRALYSGHSQESSSCSEDHKDMDSFRKVYKQGSDSFVSVIKMS